jgi:hypothetical protein
MSLQIVLRSRTNTVLREVVTFVALLLVLTQAADGQSLAAGSDARFNVYLGALLMTPVQLVLHEAAQRAGRARVSPACRLHRAR